MVKPTDEWLASRAQRPGASGRAVVALVVVLVVVMAVTLRPRRRRRKAGVILVVRGPGCTGANGGTLGP